MHPGEGRAILTPASLKDAKALPSRRPASARISAPPRLVALGAWAFGLLPRSLIGRVTLAFAAVASFSILIGVVVLDHTLNRVVWAEHERALLTSTTVLRQRIAEGGLAALRAAPLPPDTARRFDPTTGSLRFVVLDETGRVLDASRGAQPALPRLDPAGDPLPRFREGADGSTVWGLSVDFATARGGLTLQIAQDMTRGEIALDEVQNSAVAPMLLVLVGGAVILLVVNVVCVLLLLRPLRRAAQEAAAVRPGTAMRLSDADVPAEARPLIRAVNGALDRLEEALAAQRAFSLDVAHELRTPLSILLTEVELLEDQGAARQIKEDLHDLVRLVNQLLEAAEAIEARPAEGQCFDLTDLCLRLASRLGQVAEREGLSLVVAGAAAPIWVEGDADAVQRAVRNLVENAMRHSPAGGAVTLRLLAPGVVEVADHGPGLPPGDRRQLFRRFWRADRAGRSGTGLGLAIVQRIVDAQGGVVEAMDNPGGGAVFALRLRPALPRHPASRPAGLPSGGDAQPRAA